MERYLRGRIRRDEWGGGVRLLFRWERKQKKGTISMKGNELVMGGTRGNDDLGGVL